VGYARAEDHYRPPDKMVLMSKHTAVATLNTTLGPIKVNLYGNHAPKTVKNFVGLATGEIEWTHPATGEKSTKPLYDGVIFHRIIPGFMIQGGDPLGQGFGGPGYQFDDEISPDLDFTAPYVLAMANSGIQNGRGTNGSQFFITVAPTTWLQGKHSIFGAVEDPDSQAIIEKLANVATDGRDKPLEDVVIENITVEQV
jgi:peptidyl-prolyl cis-trans isomerase A (cyclophilin A)